MHHSSYVLLILIKQFVKFSLTKLYKQCVSVSIRMVGPPFHQYAVVLEAGDGWAG